MKPSEMRWLVEDDDGEVARFMHREDAEEFVSELGTSAMRVTPIERERPK